MAEGDAGVTLGVLLAEVAAGKGVCCRETEGGVGPRGVAAVVGEEVASRSNGGARVVVGRVQRRRRCWRGNPTVLLGDKENVRGGRMASARLGARVLASAVRVALIGGADAVDRGSRMEERSSRDREKTLVEKSSSAMV